MQKNHIVIEIYKGIMLFCLRNNRHEISCYMQINKEPISRFLVYLTKADLFGEAK